MKKKNETEHDMLIRSNFANSVGRGEQWCIEWEEARKEILRLIGEGSNDEGERRVHPTAGSVCLSE